MAATNNSTAQAIHQKPSVDANQRTAGPEQNGSKDPQIQGMHPEALISFIDGLADDINENAAHIQAVAFGGRSYAEQTEEPICEGMFGAILNMSESAESYIMLKNAIAELRYRPTSSAPANPITKPAPAKPGQSESLQGANDAVWVAMVGMSCIENNLSPILVAIEALTHVDGMTDKDLAKRIAAIQNLARVGVSTADDMIDTLDCERETMQEKLNALEGALS